MKSVKKVRRALAKQISEFRFFRRMNPDLNIPRLSLRTSKVFAKPPTFWDAETTFLYCEGFTIIVVFHEDAGPRICGNSFSYLVFERELPHPCSEQYSKSKQEGNLIQSCYSLIDAVVICETQNYQKRVDDALFKLRNKKHRKRASDACNVILD
jgi:hypothetical protein